MATHSSILIWEIPWIQEPGGIQVFRIIKDLKDDLGCKFARSYNHFISYIDCTDYFLSKENF